MYSEGYWEIIWRYEMDMGKWFSNIAMCCCMLQVVLGYIHAVKLMKIAELNYWTVLLSVVEYQVEIFKEQKSRHVLNKFDYWNSRNENEETI